MLLNTITASRATIKAALVAYDENTGLTAEGDDSYWSYYRCDDYDTDSTFVYAVRALSEYLLEWHPANPDDSADITLVADTDGTIGGYEFQYALTPPYLGGGAKPWLMLTTTFSEWKHVRGSRNGIEGVIDFVETVVGLLNHSIEGYNYWASA